MKLFRPSRIARRTAALLSATTMVLPVVLAAAANVIAASPAAAADTTTGTAGTERLPAVAVLDYSNTTPYGGAVLGRSAAAAVAQAMDESNHWDVLRSDAVARQITTLGLAPPFDNNSLIQLGRALDADAVVTGRVFSVQITQNPLTATVGVRAEMHGVTSGELINGAQETGIANAVPGQNDAQAVVDAALRKAAFADVNTMSRQVLPAGTILNVQPVEGGKIEALLNIGTNAGVIPGMEFVVQRGSDQVARVRAVRVEAGQTVTNVVNQTRGVRPEDRATAIFRLPDIAATPTGELKVQKGHRRSGGKDHWNNMLLGLAGIGGLVALLSKTTSHNTVSDSRAEATTLAQDPAALGSPAVKVTWSRPNNVRFDDIVEFDVYRATSGELIATLSPSETTFYDIPRTFEVNTCLLGSGGTVNTGGTTGTVTAGTTGTTTGTTGGIVTPLVGGVPVNYRIQMVYLIPQLNQTVTSSSGNTGGVSGGITGGTTSGISGGISGGITGGTTSGITGGITGGTTSGISGGINGGTTGGLNGGTTTGTVGVGNCPVSQTRSQSAIETISPVAITGTATPLMPPVPSAPAGGSGIASSNLTNLTFSWNGSQGADTYMVEIATDPSFRNAIQLSTQIFGASNRAGSQQFTLNIVNQVSKLLNGATTGTIFWHVGARNSLDNPGPEPGRFAGLTGDRRWVYSDFETFTVSPMTMTPTTPFSRLRGQRPPFRGRQR